MLCVCVCVCLGARDQIPHFCFMASPLGDQPAAAEVHRPTGSCPSDGLLPVHTPPRVRNVTCGRSFQWGGMFQGEITQVSSQDVNCRSAL